MCIRCTDKICIGGGGIFNLRNRLCRIVCSGAPESHAEIWVGGCR